MRKRRILCHSPPHKTGTVYVEVGVQSVFSFASGVMFTYEPPYLHEVYPLKGPTWGEIPITLVGSNFANIDELGNRDMHVYYKCRFYGTSFGDVTRPAQILHSGNHPLVPTTSQLLKCVAPPSNSRCVNIEASVAGTDWDRSKTPPIPQPYIVWSQGSKVSFCYERSSVSSMWPVTGPIKGGTRLRMTGMNLQPVDTTACFFEHTLIETPFANGYQVTDAYFQNSNSHSFFEQWTGVENDTEAIFCTTPAWNMAATVKVGLLLDGVRTMNTLMFRYEPGKITRVTPKNVPTRGGTMISVFGVGFEQVYKPKCKFIGNHLQQKYPGYLTVTQATVISSNLVLCPTPSRLGADDLDQNHPMSTVLTAERHTQATEQKVLRQYSGWEQVDVNAQVGNSFALRCGPRNHASAAFQRSMMLFGDVTLEAWVQFDELNYRTTDSSPIWFGLLDENLRGRFLYGIFFKTKIIHGTWMVDVEIGHTNATHGHRYAGRYNLSWPLQSSPKNLTRVFNTSLLNHQWHHLAAVKNATAQTWTLYVNATLFGSFHYGCIDCEPNPTMIQPGTIATPRHQHHRDRLAVFFIEYDPMMYDKIDSVLNKWLGNEEAMFQMLRSRYAPPAGNPSGRTNNLLPQDYILETNLNTAPSSHPPPGGRAGQGSPYKDSTAFDYDTLNAGGLDPRTRSSPFTCDPRIHGVDVCHLPWGTKGHHTVPNLYICQGPQKHQVMNGLIEEVRVWKQARTAEEIKDNYDSELDGGSLDLLAYYSFNEGHGVMAFDNSTATSGGPVHEARLHMHLLGSPREMWTISNFMAPFTDSSQYCGEACRVKYTPVPKTYYLESHSWNQYPSSIDANPYSQVFPDQFNIIPSRGPVHGGTLVTISGNDFMDSSSLGCRFTGTIPNQAGGKSQGHGFVNAKWIDMNHLVCRTPAAFGPAYTDIYLTNDGHNFDVVPVVFEYSIAIPTLYGISIEADAGTGHAPRFCPVRTPLNGGTSVTIHGRDFMQSDDSKLLQFRMGEMPAMEVVRYIDSETIVIKTPPIHSRFWGPSSSGGKPNHYASLGTPNPDMHVMPEPGRPSPLESHHKRSPFDMDERYRPWGSGKPYDCTLDAPGTMCYRPAFTVRITNDGGRTWSDFPPYNTTIDARGTLLSRTNCILYHDLIVSPRGSDESGDGTYTRPFKSTAKAAEWAHGNHDRIVLQRGHYSTGSLSATMQHGKTVEIIQESTDHLKKSAPRITTNKVKRENAGPVAWDEAGQNGRIGGGRGEASTAMHSAVPRDDSTGTVHPAMDIHNLHPPSPFL